MKRAKGCNSQLLNQLLNEDGKAVSAIAEQMEDVSESLLVRLRHGKYPYVVKEHRRNEICDYFGIEDVPTLFPYVSACEVKSAS